MAWRSAGSSLSRSMASAARASTARSAPSLPRLRPPPRRLSFANPRNLGELGCTQSLLPISFMVSTSLTSHLSGNVRAFCELSHVDKKKLGLGIDREEWKRRLMHEDIQSSQGVQ